MNVSIPYEQEQEAFWRKEDSTRNFQVWDQKIRKMCIIKTFKNWSFVIHQTSKICHISNVLISHATNVLNFHKYLFYAENHGILTDVELNIDHEIYFECHKIY